MRDKRDPNLKGASERTEVLFVWERRGGVREKQRMRSDLNLYLIAMQTDGITVTGRERLAMRGVCVWEFNAAKLEN